MNKETISGVNHAKKLVVKLWNSPTATTWLKKVAAPLKFVLLIPLVLTLLSTEEISIFYLLSSAMVLMTFVSGALTTTFTQMLAYAYSGATDLSHIKLGEKPRGTGEPNWVTFHQCFNVLKHLQLLAALPMLLVGAVILLFGVGQLISWDWSQWQYWGVVILVALGYLFDLFLNRFISACVAVGKVAQVNQIATKYILINVILSSVMLYLTHSLFYLVLSQTLVSAIQQYGISKYARRVIAENKPDFKVLDDKASKGNILKACWPPIWKSLMGVLAANGLRAYIAIYVVSMVSVWGDDLVASFLFTQNVILRLFMFSAVPLNAVKPYMSKFLSTGSLNEFKQMSQQRIAAGFLLLAAALLSMYTILPNLLELMGSKVSLLPKQALMILLILFLMRALQLFYGIAFNITNQARFVMPAVFASLIVIAILHTFKRLDVNTFIIITNIIPIIFVGVLPFKYYYSLFKNDPLRKA